MIFINAGEHLNKSCKYTGILAAFAEFRPNPGKILHSSSNLRRFPLRDEKLMHFCRINDFTRALRALHTKNASAAGIGCRGARRGSTLHRQR